TGPKQREVFVRSGCVPEQCHRADHLERSQPGRLQDCSTVRSNREGGPPPTRNPTKHELMKQRAHDAITTLVQSKDFKQCISKIEPKGLQDDLAAEVSLILLETDPEKRVRLADAHQLKIYAARV